MALLSQQLEGHPHHPGEPGDPGGLFQLFPPLFPQEGLEGV